MAKTHFAGPLQIGDQVTGTEYTILDDSNNNEVLSVNPVASATNNIGLRNAATGNNPIIYNAGEVDTGITLSGSDGTNFEEILVLDANASAVNQITIDNATTGNDPTILANGDDTNIALQLSSTGTAIVKVGSLSSGSVSSGSALVNAQRGFFIESLTAVAGTAQVTHLRNNRILPTSVIFAQVSNDAGTLTVGLPTIGVIRNETAGSCTIQILNITGGGNCAGTAKINFVVL